MLMDDINFIGNVNRLSKFEECLLRKPITHSALLVTKSIWGRKSSEKK